MTPDEEITMKRAAAIKLAKELKPYDTKLGQEFDTVYAEILTEDMKQLARETKKLAKVIDDYCKKLAADDLTVDPLTAEIGGESERVTKLMRRYSSQIITMCDLLYQAVYLDQANIAAEILHDDTEEDE